MRLLLFVSPALPVIIPIKDGNGNPYFWGLDRINQFGLPLDMNRDTQCYPAKGDGVNVFVVDSGCAVDHPEFAGVKIRSMALPSSPYDPAGVDDRGHGSHVAGTVAGKTTGVAPGAELTCIKVLNEDGRGKSSDVAAGFEHVAAYKAANPGAKVIMQASLGGSGNHHNTVMRRMAGVGVIGSVAAGNDGGDACDHTPAGSPDVITVGNMDMDDTVWRNSNIGRCVDVFARTLVRPGLGWWGVRWGKRVKMVGAERPSVSAGACIEGQRPNPPRRRSIRSPLCVHSTCPARIHSRPQDAVGGLPRHPDDQDGHEHVGSPRGGPHRAHPLQPPRRRVA